MEGGWNNGLSRRQSVAIIARFTTIAFSLSLTACPSKNSGTLPKESAARHQSMKVVMTMTGGFTGIGGKWEIEAEKAKQRVQPERVNELNRLVEQALSEGVFGKDFSKPSPVTEKTSGSAPNSVAADMQTYELSVDGQRIKWSDPSPAGAAAAPPIVESLKDWMLENAERQPYRPR